MQLPARANNIAGHTLDWNAAEYANIVTHPPTEMVHLINNWDGEWPKQAIPSSTNSCICKSHTILGCIAAMMLNTRPHLVDNTRGNIWNQHEY